MGDCCSDRENNNQGKKVKYNDQRQQPEFLPSFKNCQSSLINSIFRSC